MHDHKLVTHQFLVTCKRKNNYPMEKLGKTFAWRSKLTSPRRGKWVLST